MRWLVLLLPLLLLGAGPRPTPEKVQWVPAYVEGGTPDPACTTIKVEIWERSLACALTRCWRPHREVAPFECTMELRSDWETRMRWQCDNEDEWQNWPSPPPPPNRPPCP